ncbi:MAG: hypothetical protein OXH09_11220, partial [Gammaproteobacteria bacterium]|nr:hypothetical protein [Gammaproteobacteria bacterium]
MARPASCTAVKLSTSTLPVSVSTRVSVRSQTGPTQQRGSRSTGAAGDVRQRKRLHVGVNVRSQGSVSHQDSQGWASHQSPGIRLTRLKNLTGVHSSWLGHNARRASAIPFARSRAT